MAVRNADSLPGVGVCFSRDGLLSALAVVCRRVEGGLCVFRVSDPLPATCCQFPPVFRFPGGVALGYRPVEGALNTWRRFSVGDRRFLCTFGSVCGSCAWQIGIR